jgi:3-hydroxyisobutyrate dehydrogenase-like beta-hydroxyacid dehydrogenase
MKIKSIGIMSPGDMGSAIGNVLNIAGYHVITALEGRSELTRLRAKEAGILDVQDIDRLVTESDLILSVLVPSEALALAQRVADSVKRTGRRPVYADLNAIAPETVWKIDGIMSGAGVTFIDGGIIGAPPIRGKKNTRIYCSGTDTQPLESLKQAGLDIRKVSPVIGQASGLKMVFAASTKGITALWTELLVAARALGLEEALKAEFKTGGTDISEVLNGRVVSMPRRARRWVGEMEEIAKTFESVGLTPKMLQGAAEMYRLVGSTPLADQTSRQPNPSPEDVLRILAEKANPGK